MADTISLKKQALLLEEVQKLNRENAERSDPNLSPGLLDLEAGGPLKPERGSTSPNLLDFILEVPKAPVAEEEKEEPGDGLKEGVSEVLSAMDEKDLRECKLSEVDVLKEREEKQKEEEIKANASSEEPSEPVILELPVSPDTQNETDSIPDRYFESIHSLY